MGKTYFKIAPRDSQVWKQFYVFGLPGQCPLKVLVKFPKKIFSFFKK